MSISEKEFIDELEADPIKHEIICRVAEDGQLNMLKQLKTQYNDIFDEYYSYILMYMLEHKCPEKRMNMIKWLCEDVSKNSNLDYIEDYGLLDTCAIKGYFDEMYVIAQCIHKTHKQ